MRRGGMCRNYGTPLATMRRRAYFPFANVRRRGCLARAWRRMLTFYYSFHLNQFNKVCARFGGAAAGEEHRAAARPLAEARSFGKRGSRKFSIGAAWRVRSCKEASAGHGIWGCAL